MKRASPTFEKLASLTDRMRLAWHPRCPDLVLSGTHEVPGVPNTCSNKPGEPLTMPVLETPDVYSQEHKRYAVQMSSRLLCGEPCRRGQRNALSCAREYKLWQ